MERVSLDGVDLAGRSPARKPQEGDAQQQPAKGGNQNRAHRIDPELAGEPLAPFQIEQHRVKNADRSAHGGHYETPDHADQRCQNRKAGFMRTDKGAQPLRGLEIAGGWDHRAASGICGREPGARHGV